jgi:hypothetical protein
MGGYADNYYGRSCQQLMPLASKYNTIWTALTAVASREPTGPLLAALPAIILGRRCRHSTLLGSPADNTLGRLCLNFQLLRLVPAGGLIG